MTDQQPTLTIGMAHYDDWDGVYFTLQSIATQHAATQEGRELLKRIQFVVVDNSPHIQPVAKSIYTVLQRVGELCHSTKYVKHTDPVGTSPTRNRIIDEAEGDYVMVMDCHVLLYPQVIRRLFDHIKKHDPIDDLMQGPMVHDNHNAFSTHFNNYWRGQMWGGWGAAWVDPHTGEAFTCQASKDNKVETRDIMTFKPKDYGDITGRKIPWPLHEHTLKKLGFVRVGENDDDPIIEIPGQGLGMFVTRRESWLRFNDDCRGFGGEEMYIHGKYREAGRAALCVPWLRWVHRFSRPDGVPYPLSVDHKVRNYLIEFQEMGWDTTPIYEHFVKGNNWGLDMSQTPTFDEKKFAIIKADPVAFKVNAHAPNGGQGGHMPDKPRQRTESLEEMYERLHKTERDLNMHMPLLKKYAAKCGKVAEISGRRESSVALLAGKPKDFWSFNPEGTSLRDSAEATPGTGHHYAATDPNRINQLEHDVDLLFLDIDQRYDLYRERLDQLAPQVKRFIIVHDTHTFGNQGKDGGKGVRDALNDFMRDHPEWSVLHHTPLQHGLTVIGCQDQDKPELPSTFEQVKNFSKAATEHIATGSKMASQKEYEHRLNTCALCTWRKDARCSVCGCFIEKKASWAESSCPEGFWTAEQKESTEDE